MVKKSAACRLARYARRVERRIRPARSFARWISACSVWAWAGCGDNDVIELFKDKADAGSIAQEVTCTSDGQCTESERHCDPASNTCVQCLVHTDCGGQADVVCDARLHVCTRTCSASSGCSEGICDTAAGFCVECLGDVECEANERCLTPQGKCVRCLSDADCASEGASPHCWLARHQCVECNSNAECAGHVCTVEHSCSN